MNALRLMVTGLVMIGLGAGLSAEEKKANGNKEKLVGAWEVIKADEGALPVGSVVELSKDGKASVTAKREGKESTAQGTYAVEGDKLTVTLKHGEKEVKHAITIKKLT